MKVAYVTQELAFTSVDDCIGFLTSLGAVLDPTQTLIDCKATVSKL